MIGIFFGLNGRLGRICQRAFQVIDPQIQIFNFSRHGLWTLESSTESVELNHVDELLSIVHGKECIIFDCSVDHQSTRAMVEHERKKQALILAINRIGIVTKYVGFSSGITCIPESAIKPCYTHMQRYRELKLMQESFVLKLKTSIFLPNIFTLIGPETYKKKSASWAEILYKRVDQNETCTINDPLQKRSWVSEATVYEKLLVFLGTKKEQSLIGPLSDGIFQLESIATTRLNGLIPALKFSVGESSSWLLGEYCSVGEFNETRKLDLVLLASLNLGND